MAIDVTSFEQIAPILSQLATNYSNIFFDYFNLFYNPTEMDVTIEYYDTEGVLRTITIPNRAKDRRYILNGNENPEGAVSGVKGSIYQDLTNGILYIKQSAEDQTGWVQLISSEELSKFLTQGNGSPEGEVAAQKGTLYVNLNTAALYIKTTEVGNVGWTMISANTEDLADKDLSNLSVEGESHFANPDFSNLSVAGQGKLDAKEDKANKVSTISSSSTDSQYPSAKAVYDLVGGELISTANNDLSNLTTNGEEHFVSLESQIRDGILKAPNGLPSVTGNIISLPQGTVLLCADGINDNNAVVNSKYMTLSYLSASVNWSGSNEGVAFYNKSNNTVIYYPVGCFNRGLVAPTGETNMIWLNPNNNKYKITTNSGSTWSEIVAAEIGRFTTDSTGSINSFTPRHPFVVATMDDLNNVRNSGTAVRSIGEIVSSTIPLTDAGLHLLDGSVIDGSGIYSAFVSYIADLYGDGTNVPNYFCSEADWQQSITDYGVCGKFVYDSTDSTVRLPKITGIIEGTTDATALGDLVEAGLPNITASWNTVNDGSVSGAVYRTSSWGDLVDTGDSGGWGTASSLDFSATNSDSIYGSSTTVQPQTIKVLYYIVAATVTKTNIQVDIDNVVTDLNDKVDRGDLAEVQCVVETYRNGTSWYRVYSDGWCEQGGVYGNSANKDSVMLLKSYIDNNYNVQLTSFNATEGTSTSNIKVNSKSASSFELWVESAERPVMWRAEGYII